MRFSFALLSVASLVASVAWAAEPTPSRRSRELKQVTARELAARAKYPEHFLSRYTPRRDGGSEGELAPREGQPSGTPDPDCLTTGVQQTRREFIQDQVLTPKELHAFLKGQGKFVSDNGTVYIDEHYIRTVSQGREYAKRFPRAHSMYRKVKDKVGRTLLSLSVPVYKKWKDSLTPGSVFWLSAQTYIRHEDVPEIERLFLEDPDFTEIEVHGVQMTRSFFEAVAAY